MSRFNNRGEIIHDTPSSSNTATNSRNYLTRSNIDQRNQFLTTTLIGSPIVYSIVGLIANQAMTIGWAPSAAFLVGGLYGFLVTIIYDFAIAKNYTTKEYTLGFLAPGVIILGITLGLAILGIIIFLFVLAGLASGGG